MATGYESSRERLRDARDALHQGRSGLTRLVSGSTAERVLRQAPCSVLVVRERGHVAGAVSESQQLAAEHGSKRRGRYE